MVLGILSLLTYLSGKILQKKNSKPLLSISLIIVILLFCLRNYEYLQDAISNTFLAFINAPILSVQKIGLSYILFRFVHWLIESFRKNIEQTNFITFLNYVFFFPSILAGPIDTYKNYHYWLHKNNNNYQRELFFAGITRIFIGAIKTLAIVPLVIDYATDYSELMPEFGMTSALMISLFAYSVYIYFDFSGYCDIAIGTAYLLGIKTPENFNNPYVAENLSVFWKRWHITFSNFLKRYVFMPFIKLFNGIINPKHRLLVTILCYLTTFTVCGLWHGSTVNFVYWGLWHGAGLAVNKIYSLKVKPKISWSKSSVYRLGSIALTFVFVTIGWVFFHYNTTQLSTIFNQLFA